MKIDVKEFLHDYLECPRRYLHRQLNANKAEMPRWMSRKDDILNLALGKVAPIDVMNNVDESSSEVLKAFLKANKIVEHTWDIHWNDKHTLTYTGLLKVPEEIPIYIHISSSEFRQYPMLQTLLFLIKEPKLHLVTHLEPKFRQKQSETLPQFVGRFCSAITHKTKEVIVTPQEAESNKHWILKVLNRLRKGDYSTYNPNACMKVVDLCPFYRLCWHYKPVS